ncbi:hypothetical protein GOP47_0005226 [Adiantum capillus-veneris]|uniref:Enoyl reductase (ER) domain-containing protein n=1 Tax=Adiantum capillus-veneris TaxID=13818 RepID=A0A9D4ZN16_ADICA|nr:hypothetical protein GOP47_0005226 [Adiantum capillus-veneris]
MKAIVITRPGGPDVLEFQEVPDPELRPGHVIVRISAAAINRADTYQNRGMHAVPPGCAPYPGLECSGTIEAVADDVQSWKVGDQVCALLGGGGYAEKVSVPAVHLLPIPKGVSLQDAAGLPEVVCTVWSTVFMTSHLSSGENFLVHGGSSGIGTFAIQIAKYIGAKVFCTAGDLTKLEQCRVLGADVLINYKEEDFVKRVKEETGGKGVNVILDNMGALYLQRNLDALSMDGRLFIIGFQGGNSGEVNLGPILSKRLTVQGAGLRGRSVEKKAQIVDEVLTHVWPAVECGKVKPVIYKTFPLAQAADAQRLLETSKHVGKILLIP